MADVRVSQVIVESAEQVQTDLRVSQLVVEHAQTPEIALRVSQFVAEVMYANTIPLRVSQFIIEYLTVAGSSPTAPGKPGCPVEFPVEPSADHACVPTWTP